MPLFRGTRYSVLAGAGGIEYLLLDRFSTPLAAGAVDGTAAVPGPGTRTVTDVEDKIAIAGGLCVFTEQATKAWGEQGLRYGAVTRAAGRMLRWKINLVQNSGDSGIGWNNAADFPIWNGQDNAIKPGTTLEATFGTSRARFLETLALSTDYRFALVLRAVGCYYFVQGGAFTYWTLFWIDSTMDRAALYPTLSCYMADFSIDDFRVPDVLWIPKPLAYDEFTRADGAIGDSEVAGPDSQVVTARTWNNRVGTTQIASNEASASALAGGLAIATVDTGTVNAIVTATLSRSAAEVGIVLRYEDTNNYIRAIHDGTNCKLIKRVAGVESDVISSAVAIGAGAIRVIADGTSFKLFLNNAKEGATSTISDAGLQTGTEQGLYSTNTGNTQDDFGVFPRGTDGEYSVLDRY